VANSRIEPVQRGSAVLFNSVGHVVKMKGVPLETLVSRKAKVMRLSDLFVREVLDVEFHSTRKTRRIYWLLVNAPEGVRLYRLEWIFGNKRLWRVQLLPRTTRVFDYVRAWPRLEARRVPNIVLRHVRATLAAEIGLPSRFPHPRELQMEGLYYCTLLVGKGLSGFRLAVSVDDVVCFAGSLAGRKISNYQLIIEVAAFCEAHVPFQKARELTGSLVEALAQPKSKTEKGMLSMLINFWYEDE
jgi:hypothetical protein